MAHLKHAFLPIIVINSIEGLEKHQDTSLGRLKFDDLALFLLLLDLFYVLCLGFLDCFLCSSLLCSLLWRYNLLLPSRRVLRAAEVVDDSLLLC